MFVPKDRSEGPPLTNADPVEDDGDESAPRIGRWRKGVAIGLAAVSASTLIPQNSDGAEAPNNEVPFAPDHAATVVLPHVPTMADHLADMGLSLPPEFYTAATIAPAPATVDVEVDAAAPADSMDEEMRTLRALRAQRAADRDSIAASQQRGAADIQAAEAVEAQRAPEVIEAAPLDLNSIPAPVEGGLFQPNVERWRPWVETYFAPEDVDKALWVIEHESGGLHDAANSHSSARGLFQHLKRMWPERLARVGLPTDTDIFNPNANVALAAWLVYDAGGWSHWAVVYNYDAGAFKKGLPYDYRGGGQDGWELPSLENIG